MTYALNLSEDNRIKSAWVVLPNGNYDDMPIVESLPEGNLPDYLYVNSEFVYNPPPELEKTTPEITADDILNTLLGVTE